MANENIVSQVSLEAETSRDYQRVSQVTLMARTSESGGSLPTGGGLPWVQVHHWYSFETE